MGSGKIDKKSVASLWAKKSDTGGTFSWLPLLVHLEDTMNISGWLWSHWITDGQRQMIIDQMQPADEDVAENAIRFLGCVHDIGKATPVFQIQKGYSSSPDLDNVLLERIEGCGYSDIRELVLASPRCSHHSLAGQVILSRSGVREDLASIIGAHHGNPVDERSICDNQEFYPTNYYQSEEASSDIWCRWYDTQAFILKLALDQCGFFDVKALPSFSIPAQVILSGILIMADWIASNTDYFPLIPVNQTEILDENYRFSKGIRDWCKSLPLKFEEPDNINNLYEKRFSFMPRNVQEVIFNTINNTQSPGLMIIEAPTGIGKTEAALAAAEQIAAKTSRGGVFFGLPTQATSNGIFERINNWLEGVTKEYDCTSSIRLVHGKAALNSIMQTLMDASHVAEDYEDQETVIVNEWFSGRKKTMLDDIVVGTVDNFLLTALRQKHLALRHLGFQKKVVIIDEVHAYDAYMQEYLYEAIRWMGAYGVPVILLSATLPCNIRIKLTEAYLRGLGLKKREIDMSQIEPRSDQYPLITYTDGGNVKQNDKFLKQRNKKVFIESLKESVLYDKIEELIQKGGIIGIIVNTVKRAQHIAKQCSELFGEDKVDLLHSNFISAGRIRKEGQLIRMIGKNANRPRTKIIIGTQVMEQSLDIDFDVLITDLCPMDLLIQRIGRLHRHDIKRPEQHKEPVVFILGMNEKFEFEEGSERVYGGYLLMRTQKFLPSSIFIPGDVSSLVQKVYSEEFPFTVDTNGELKNKYAAFRARFYQLSNEKSERAKIFRIDPPSKKIAPERKNLIGWLRTHFSYSEEEAVAQVRDIQDTIEVIAVRTCGNGYGLIEADDRSNMDISEHLEETEVCRMLAGQTLRLPNYVNAMMGGTYKLIEVLENYNRKYLKEWQSRPWLKGSLGIIFDEKLEFDLGKIVLQYNSKYGLRIISKEVKNEQV